MLSDRSSVLETFDTRPLAEAAAKAAADTLVSLGAQSEWGVYLHVIHVPGVRHRVWALSVGRHDAWEKDDKEEWVWQLT